MRIDEKIQATIIIILIVYGMLVAAPILLGKRVVEPFSELGVLGPNMKLGDYPRNVETGKSVNLYLYIGNYEGGPRYYRIYVKLGDQFTNVSDTEAYPGEILFQYDRVLLDETNHTAPFKLALSEPGVNKRLVFELHKYQDDEFKYFGLWTQIWMNVTATQ
jgi:uncharacterized membrane protein